MRARQLDLSGIGGGGGASAATDVSYDATGNSVLTGNDVQEVLDQADAAIAALENKYVRTTRFASIGAGTSGTVTIPANSTVVLDDFGGTVDAIVTGITSSRPDFEPVYTAGGAVVATSYDGSGNYTLTGTPSAYPVAILYRVQQRLEDFDSSSSDIVGAPQLVTVASGITNDSGVAGTTVAAALDALNTGKATSGHTHGSGDVSDFGEAVDDRVAVLIQNGTGITWAYNDVGNTLTPSVTITQYTDSLAKAACVADAINDAITDVAPSQNAVFDALAGKAAVSHSHYASDISDFGEAVDDRVSTLIQNGTGITWTYSDAGNTLTPTVTITQYTDEMAQDAVGTMVADTDTINATYTDGTPELKFDARVQMSITSDASGLKLSGDSASPGNTMLYGTNGSGVKGWYAQPSGGSGSGLDGLWSDNIDGWTIQYSEYTGGISPTWTIGWQTGTGAGSTGPTTDAAPLLSAGGVLLLDTGTTSTGRAGRANISGAMNLGFKTGMEYILGANFYLEDAPDATEDYFVFIGFTMSSGLDPRSNESTGLYYDRNYTNWQYLQYYGATAYYTDTGVAFAADTWFDLAVKIVGNDTYSSVNQYGYINGTLVATPTATVQNVSNNWGAQYCIWKTAGATQRDLYVDYDYLMIRRT